MQTKMVTMTTTLMMTHMTKTMLMMTKTLMMTMMMMIFHTVDWEVKMMKIVIIE